MINHTVAIQVFPICTLSPGLLIFPFVYIEQDPPSKHQLVFFARMVFAWLLENISHKEP